MKEGEGGKGDKRKKREEDQMVSLSEQNFDSERRDPCMYVPIIITRLIWGIVSSTIMLIPAVLKDGYSALLELRSYIKILLVISWTAGNSSIQEAEVREWP